MPNINFDTVLGLACRELGWVPAPSYILRRATILEQLVNHPPGRVLEIGCGVGALLYDLSKRGFQGICVEASPLARNLAAQVLSGTPMFKVVDRLSDLEIESFEYLMAFEVLEHIEDDQAALFEWRNYLKPSGWFLLSVPAHQSKWSASDEWAGHYRRYNRNEIVAKLENAGFAIVSVISYGWPLSNMIHPIQSWVSWKKLKHSMFFGQKREREELTLQIGTERRIESWLYPLYNNSFGRRLFNLFIKVQRLFYLTDWGIGYLVVARKL